MARPVRPAVPGALNGRPARPVGLPALLRHGTTAVWALLVVATLVSWWLGDGHGDGRTATIGVLVVAFVKGGLVGRSFMELRDAPVVLQAVFGGWCVVVCSVLVALYLIL